MLSLGFILPPLVGCLLIVIINVYFGIHVIKREIIFIDIALASIAALGSALGLVLFHSEQSGHSHELNAFLPYLFSILFILLASLVFTLLKNRKIAIPLEALIGIAYAVATTLTVIILDKGAGGDVHVHDMLVGSILWVSWKEIIRLAIIVSIAGVFHLIFHKKFQKLTDSFGSDCEKLRYPGIWDFLFYFSFGLVVVEAVSIAGILTVFALLILPASISSFISKNMISKLAVGWTAGIVASLSGLLLSIKLDLPSAPLIIVLLGLFLIIVFVAYKMKRMLR